MFAAAGSAQKDSSLFTSLGRRSQPMACTAATAATAGRGHRHSGANAMSRLDDAARARQRGHAKPAMQAMNSAAPGISLERCRLRLPPGRPFPTRRATSAAMNRHGMRDAELIDIADVAGRSRPRPSTPKGQRQLENPFAQRIAGVLHPTPAAPPAAGRDSTDCGRLNIHCINALSRGPPERQGICAQTPRSPHG
jgi:hypothetical protein